MSYIDLDHDSQRELEQRALRNVSGLVEKLGAQDALDQRSEKTLVVYIAVVAVVAILGLGISVMLQQAQSEAALARQRCEVDVRVRETPAVRNQILGAFPRMTAAGQAEIFERTIRGIAAGRCAKASTAR